MTGYRKEIGHTARLQAMQVGEVWELDRWDNVLSVRSVASSFKTLRGWQFTVIRCEEPGVPYRCTRVK